MAHAHAHEAEVAVGANIFGMIAEFDDPDALLAAALRAKEAGYIHTEGYSPVPIHGLAEAVGFNDYRIPKVAFLGGLAGAFVGFLGMYYTNVVDYPWNVGGKPLLSWPMFIPIAYECTILFAAGATFFAMWTLNGLPKYYHPVFNAKNFQRASQDRFFLLIDKTDPQYDSVETFHFLRGLSGVLDVSEVEK
jgi:hypothetical protein